MLIWFGILVYLFLFAALGWIMFLLVKVIFDKEFAKTPPFVPTFGAEKSIMIEEISKVLQESNQKEMTLIDPGCGIGTILIELAKKFPNHKFVGTEWSLPVYVICKLRCSKYKNISVSRGDLFKSSFAKADIIACFLMQPLMERVGEKIKQEGKKGLLVFSNSFTIPNLKLVQTYKTTKKGFIENVYKYNLGF